MSGPATMESPLVSIGLPTYNRAQRFERALRSAVAQSYTNLEIVVSDNASDDATADVCVRVANNDRRVRYIRQPVNRGMQANFRAVLAEARGELFMWLGDDDWLDPEYVSACAGFLRDNPGHSLVAGFDRYYRQGRVEREGPRLTLEESSGQERVMAYFRQVTMNGVFYGLMRRALLSSIPFSDVLGNDWMVISAAAFVGKVRTLDTVCVNRSAEGVSMDVSSLARAFGLSTFEKANPFLTVATNVFRDICWQSPIYRSLSDLERLALAVRAFHIIFRRYYSRREVVRIGRQLLESLAAKGSADARAGRMSS
jgi:glycosyltransferase involved in cell wall biosynthesis